MAGDDDAVGARRASGLLGSLKHLTATLVAVVQLRLQLLANELEEEKLRLAQLGLMAAAAIFFLSLSVMLLTLLVIVWNWDNNRLLAIGGFAGIYLVLGLVFGAMMVKRANERSNLFAASLRELGKDREHLSS